MTEQQILEYNKRCAVFIGAKPCLDWQGNDGYQHPDWHHLQWSNKYKDNLELYSYRYSHLKFDSDWNWIMSVVEAIQKDGKYSVRICLDFCEIESNDGEFSESTISMVNCSYDQVSMGPTTKEAVIQAINQFLIWYENYDTKTKAAT